MGAVRGATIGGIGVTTFLLSVAVATEAASAVIEFSVFVGIPAGIVGAAITMVVAARMLGQSASRETVAVGAAIAAVGYAVLAGFALRYAVSATRDVLSPALIAGLSLVVGLGVGVGVWFSRS